MDSSPFHSFTLLILCSWNVHLSTRFHSFPGVFTRRELPRYILAVLWHTSPREMNLPIYKIKADKHYKQKRRTRLALSLLLGLMACRLRCETPEWCLASEGRYLS